MMEPDGSPQPNLEETSPEEGRPEIAQVTGSGSGVVGAILAPTLALLAALIVGAIIIALTDLDAYGLFAEDPLSGLKEMADGVWVAYSSLFVGAFGSVYAVSETLFAATPLILAGLAVALGFRAGLFNIGVNGQMMIGGMAHPFQLS